MNNSIETVNPSDVITIKSIPNALVITVNEEGEYQDDVMLKEFYDMKGDFKLNKRFFVGLQSLNFVTEYEHSYVGIDKEIGSSTHLEMTIFQVSEAAKEVMENLDSDEYEQYEYFMVPSQFVSHGTSPSITQPLTTSFVQ